MTDEILKTLVVEVRDGDGRVEKVVADGPRILIGSGAHCDVCLPPGSAAPEHVEVTVNAQGDLVAHALADEPRTRLRGARFRRAALRPGDPLVIGTITLDIRVADGAAGNRRSKGGPRRTLVIACAAASVALVFSLQARRGDAGAPTPNPPALWPAATSATCTASEPATAIAMANDLRARADAKRERLRFAVHEGVDAVELLDRAAACFRVGGQRENAAEVAEVGARLRSRVNESYRGHQLRLEHALATDEIDTALREVRILRAMTPAGTGRWAEWLTALDRSLQQRQQTQQKKTGT